MTKNTYKNPHIKFGNLMKSTVVFIAANLETRKLFSM